MKTYKKIFTFLLLLTLAFFIGCQDMQVPVVSNTDTQSGIASVNRFQDSSENNTAVDAAVKLAQDHAKLLDENDLLKQKFQILTTENEKLKKQVASLEPELKQTKKELDQANDFLVDMTTELNNWKMQVLGFQDQMRQANKAQMQMLLKIAQAMGAEVSAEQQKNDKLSNQTLTPGDANE